MLEAPSASVSVRRILVVDDEAALRSVIRRYLGRQGWEVTEARSADEALELLRDLDRFLDAVLVDMHLPDLPGTALCRRIVGEHPALAGRLLMATGDAATAGEALTRQALDCPVIGKPFDLPDLDRALAELLGRLATTPQES